VKFPSARKLFQVYALALVAIGAVVLVGNAIVGGGRMLAPGYPQAAPAIDFATAVAFRGPAPAAPAGKTGEPFFYGPLEAGECLPSIDILDFEPHFAFQGFGVIFNFAVERDGDLATVASRAQWPEHLPDGATHVQACFPSGIEFEQTVWLAPRAGRRAASPFLGHPKIAPPPLRRSPGTMAMNLGRNAAGPVVVHGRSVFSAVGLKCELRLEGAHPIVVEFGNIGEGWKFVAHETLRVGAGEKKLDVVDVGWTHFRIVLPEGGTRAHLSLTPAPSV